MASSTTITVDIARIEEMTAVLKAVTAVVETVEGWRPLDADLDRAVDSLQEALSELKELSQ